MVPKVQQQVIINPNDDPNVAPREDGGGGGGEGLAEGGEFEVKSEWEACVGGHDFFGDLPPYSQWDPRVIPDNAVYTADELRGNVGCEHNPFDLTSFWMDRSIEMGHVDEEVRCCYSEEPDLRASVVRENVVKSGQIGFTSCDAYVSFIRLVTRSLNLIWYRL